MISTLKGNISLLDFDLIVDPTNQQVLPMQGVSAQIFHQSGNEMMKACQALNGLEVGKAKMTESFNLPCKAVIHTCGPRMIICEKMIWNRSILPFHVFLQVSMHIQIMRLVQLRFKQ